MRESRGESRNWQRGHCAGGMMQKVKSSILCTVQCRSKIKQKRYVVARLCSVGGDKRILRWPQRPHCDRQRKLQPRRPRRPQQQSWICICATTTYTFVEVGRMTLEESYEFAHSTLYIRMVRIVLLYLKWLVSSSAVTKLYWPSRIACKGKRYHSLCSV